MTPIDLFEILEDLIKENGFNAVKDTVDSMWTLLKHLDGEDDFVERKQKGNEMEIIIARVLLFLACVLFIVAPN